MDTLTVLHTLQEGASTFVPEGLTFHPQAPVLARTTNDGRAIRLSRLPDLKPSTSDHESRDPRTWDVFLSHASEDKDVAEPLARALEQRGLRVWLDSAELELADALHKRINHGLANSRYGVVLLSRTYLKKRWTLDELEAILAREKLQEAERVALPVLHEMTVSELSAEWPTLAGRLAGKTDHGIDALAAALHDRISKPKTAA